MFKASIGMMKAVLRWAGLEVRNAKTVYVDAFGDLADILGRPTTPVVIDVGANQGATIASILDELPGAVIHAFEPTPDLCQHLRERFHEDHRVIVNAEAISDRAGVVTFHLMTHNSHNSLLPYADASSGYHGVRPSGSQSVCTTTIDDYCRQQGLERIDLLKIDVQGAERLVLEGARSMLLKGSISCIYLEITFSKAYEGQATLGELEAILLPADYRLYGLYEIARDSNGFLDFCNALFVSPGCLSSLRSSGSSRPEPV